MLGPPAPFYSKFPTHPQTDIVLKTEDISPGDRKLVIILPVDSSSPDLCKLISSAVALGYPAPIIVNWKKDFHTDEEGIGPSQLGKISGVLDYLDWATREDIDEEDRLNEDDIVLTLDAHDIWFQLPPQVLLNRYFQNIQQADQRLAVEGGIADSDAAHHSILVSAQKGCFSPRDSVSNAHCDQVPSSTLPPDVYGLFTDTKIHGWQYILPKWVNSGSFMGPAGDMKRYFRRVGDKMDRYLRALREDQELGGDQGIFAEVFGEQEIWRKRLAEQNDDEGRMSVALMGETYEYHVGLDYLQNLFYPTCYSETDGNFVVLDDAKAVKSESWKAGIRTPRIQGVPSDIAGADGPLAALGDLDNEEDNDWGKMSLYTDFWTTAIPVVLHHNAWKRNLKSRIVTWWDRTWYFPYLRQLIEAHLHPAEDSGPLVRLPANNGSLQIWPSDMKRETRNPLIFGRKSSEDNWALHAAEWDTVCRNDNATMEAEHHWYDEVFRDGKGPL